MSAKPKSFAVILTDLAGRAALSPPRLAEAAGIHRSHAHRLLSGAQEPSWSVLVRLARALGVGLEAFDPDRHR